jgi:hypothetical protein
MADLARLVTMLEAQTAKYSADLDRANRKLDSFGRSAGATLKRFDSAAKQAARGIKAFGASAYRVGERIGEVLAVIVVGGLVGCALAGLALAGLSMLRSLA